VRAVVVDCVSLTSFHASTASWKMLLRCSDIDCIGDLALAALLLRHIHIAAAEQN